MALEPVAARVSTPLTAADGVEYTNTFGLTGLCGSAVLDVCAVVDYENQVAKIGLFLDTREGAGQEVNGKLVVFYPGLATISATHGASLGYLQFLNRAILTTHISGSLQKRISRPSFTRTGRAQIFRFRF